MTAYHGFRFAIENEWLNESTAIRDVLLKTNIDGDFDLTTAPHWISAFFSIPLNIVVPQMCYILLSVRSIRALVRHFMGKGQTAACLYELWESLTLVCLLISPVATPFIGVLILVQSVSAILLADLTLEFSVPRLLSITGTIALVQTQVFFVSGHLCEFAGLLYTAAFVGLRDYNFIKSGILLATDTFGAMVATIVGLVMLLVIKPPVKEGRASRGSRASTSSPGSSLAPPLSSYIDTIIDQSHAPGWTTFMTLLLLGIPRSLACFAAMLSAGIQRRHLYAWALFAPKFVFEVFFVLITDLIILILSFLL